MEGGCFLGSIDPPHAYILRVPGLASQPLLDVNCRLRWLCSSPRPAHAHQLAHTHIHTRTRTHAHMVVVTGRWIDGSLVMMIVDVVWVLWLGLGHVTHTVQGPRLPEPIDCGASPSRGAPAAKDTLRRGNALSDALGSGCSLFVCAGSVTQLTTDRPTDPAEVA
eukprot:GHVU01011597.1.p2 GENE.GHVU01011597.1~~GHVU01011597.1.p2  ORF type:complete len:164 (+),score=0.80 GHVU01011597.1:274-765(+)